MSAGIPAFFRRIRWPSWGRTCRSARTPPAITTRRRCGGRWASWSISAGSSAAHPPYRRGRQCRTGEMRYFDSRDMALDVRHVMASGALPPAFPAVRIDGELYWRGHSLEYPGRGGVRRQSAQNSLVFAVHIWNPHGRSRTRCGRSQPAKGYPVFESRRQPHRPPEADPPAAPRDRRTREARCPRRERIAPRSASWRPTAASPACTWFACSRRASTARTTPRTSTSAPPASGAPRGRLCRHQRVLELAPWPAFDPIEGFILHEARPGTVMTAA